LTKIEKDAQWEEIFTILIFCSLVRRKREGVGGGRGWALPVKKHSTSGTAADARVC